MEKHGKCKVFTTIFESRKEAEDAINDLQAIKEHYGEVSIADLMDMQGIMQYTDAYRSKFINPTSLKIRRVVSYKIDVPYDFEEE